MNNVWGIREEKENNHLAILGKENEIIKEFFFHSTVFVGNYEEYKRQENDNRNEEKKLKQSE